MKRFIMVVVFGLIGLLVAAFGLALFIDPTWQVQRSVVIAGAPEKVFPYINSLQRWPQWTAWNPVTHPTMTVRHDGPESGVGAVQRWSDGNADGMIIITESRPNDFIAYQLTMDDGAHAMQGRLQLTPRPEGTRVTWQLSGHSGANLIRRLVMLVFKPLIAGDFETGLNTLKTRIETGRAVTASR